MESITNHWEYEEALVRERVALRAENKRLRAALLRLVRKGTDGRWYTSQNGDTDVTGIVGLCPCETIRAHEQKVTEK